MKRVKSSLITLVTILSATIPQALAFNSYNSPDSFPVQLAIPRLDNQVEVDGEINASEWQNAKKILINNVTRPYNNIVSPVYTEALIFDDGSALNIAFMAEDPHPEEIRAFLRDRDKAWGDDTVGIKIDTYNDQRSAYRFLVNPLGVKIDGIENEVTKKESDAWDGIWHAAGQINDKGYVVEMALPYRMLNFAESSSPQDWGIELLRIYPRDERLRLSNIYLDRNNNCEICQLVTATGFEGAKQGDNLIVTPSLVTGVSESLNADNKWERSNNSEASLDVRWGITPDILLNATINPDFSTIETDSAQLDINNNFALFNEEKRPFFLDNADYFDTNFNLVYTRNINAPGYGAKLTGRQGDHALGVFITDDESTNILIPGNRSSSVATIDDTSQAAAIRYRFNYDENTTFGWISTLRQSEGYDNVVHGIDARKRLTTSDVIKFQSLYSSTDYPIDLFKQFCESDESDACRSPNEIACGFDDCEFNERVLRTKMDKPFSGNALRAGYYHSDSDWDYRVSYDKINSGFRGDLGFMTQVDYNKFVVGGERKWYAQPGKFWNKFKIYSDWDITHNDNGELIEKEFDISAQINAKMNSHLRVAFSHRDLVGSRIDGSDLAIKGNTTLFTEKQFNLSGSIKPALGLNLHASVKFGDAIDYRNNRLGELTQLNTSINWNVNQHLEFKLKQTYRQLDADNANVFIARLFDWRTTYQFNVKSFLRLSIIYNNTSRNPNNYIYQAPHEIDRYRKNLATELLYAYKINPQTVFYLGYSDHYGGSERFSDIEQDQRTVFMKVSYAWMK
ncbi:carbohydrate binding family 9 domain-containing protein [Thalassotalea fusca]